MKRDTAPVRALFLSLLSSLQLTSPARVEFNDNDVKMSAQVYAGG